MADIATQKIRSVAVSPENHEIDLDLREVFNLIKHNWKIIAATTLVFFIYGVFYAETRPPVYRSTAMIELSSDSPPAGLGSTGSTMSVMTLQQGSSADLETVLLQSPYILGDVVRQMRMDISVSPQYSSYFSRKIAQRRGLPQQASISVLNVPNQLLEKSLTLLVRDYGQYSLFTHDGKKILDGKVGIVESKKYLSQPLQIQVEKIDAISGAKFNVMRLSTKDVASGLGSGLEVKEEGEGTGVLGLSYTSSSPEGAQQLLNAILLAAVAKNLEEKSEEAEKMLRFITQQLPEYKQKLQDAESQLNQYGIKTGVFDFIGEVQNLETNVSTLQGALETLEMQKATLLEKFTSIHPLVIAVTRQERQVQRQIDKIKTQLRKLPAVGQQELNLKSDIKIAGNAYTALIQNQQVMEMMKAGTVSSVKILSSASYPISRIPVKKRMIVFSSIMLGLISSLGFIFVRFVLSPVIEDPDEVEKALGVPVLAIIPYSQKQVAYNKKIVFDKHISKTNPFLLARENAKDLSIEALRSLRTSIQMSLLESSNNVIAITGCQPGIGKSFVCSNLSALISDLGKRVLVIDSDIRLGRMHLGFGKSNLPGLATFLKQETSLENIIQTVVPDRLDFISTGLYPDNPSELLAQPELSELIQAVRARYDVIMIDTPPILAVTDAALISRFAGLTLMVLGVGKDRIKEVHHALNILEKSGINLTGIVFNTLSPPKPGTIYEKYSYHYAYENKV